MATTSIPRNIQLLKQLQKASRDLIEIAGRTEEPEVKALSTSVNIVINELMLLEKPDFHVNHVATGVALLREGQVLVKASVPVDADDFDEVSGDLRPDAINARISELQVRLNTVIEALDDVSGSAARAFLDRVAEWEISLYAHRHEEFALPPEQGKHEITQDALLAYLSARFPDWTNLKITRFAPLYGGYSKKTIIFETHDDLNGAQALVMRAEQGKSVYPFFAGSDLCNEFPTVQLMHRAGLPVAEPLWLEEDTSRLGCRFSVSRRVNGTSFQNLGKPNEAVAPLVASQIKDMIDVMIRMHNVHLNADDPLVRKTHLHPWLRFGTLRENTLHFVESFMATAIRDAGITPTPLITRLYRWLVDNVPDDDAPAVVTHLDYAFNNLLFAKDRVAAVLDWETSRVGDPAGDIVWTLKTSGGLIDKADFLSRYEAGTGQKISEYRLLYFDILFAFEVTVAIMCDLQHIERNDWASPTQCISAYRHIYPNCRGVIDLIARADAEKRTLS